ncbi:hypothetical protein JCM10213_007841 [Rhodosporidiobolus nylandii]
MSSTPDSASEKQHVEHKEHATPSATRTDAEAFTVDKAWEKRVVRKIDWRLIPILSAVYAISLIDRTNVSIARVAGMGRDLELTVGERYSIITCLFFVPYIIFEMPANLLLRKIGVRNQLTFIIVAWGAVMLGMGWLKTWEELAVCRVLLGLMEAGFFPACTYLISTWYTRFETQSRFSFFYLSSMCLSGFSNIIGYGISLLDGSHGLEGWRWIFIVFGVVTIGLGIISFFLVQDFPDKATFLTEEERKLVTDRVNADRGDAEPDKQTFAKVLSHCADFKVWAFGMNFLCSTMPAYAFSYFLPVILAGGGYDTKTSLCLSAPPYVFAAIYTAVIGICADKFRQRALFICLSATVCFVGLFIMAYTDSLGVRYFGSFLTIAGAQANVPASLAYGANNVLSHSKRAVSTAIIIGLGGCGGILASTAYRQVDAPLYLPGLWATIGCQFYILANCAVLSWYFRSRNKKADRGEVVIEGNPAFRYTL